MKKIINGRKYDTETATKIDAWSNNCTRFSSCYEALYRKKTGEFFLYGEGGPMSKYAESCGDNCTTGGEAIIPLTEQKAKEWMENHSTVEDYEQVFGEVEE